MRPRTQEDLLLRRPPPSFLQSHWKHAFHPGCQGEAQAHVDGAQHHDRGQSDKKKVKLNKRSRLACTHVSFYLVFILVLDVNTHTNTPVWSLSRGKAGRVHLYQLYTQGNAPEIRKQRRSCCPAAAASTACRAPAAGSRAGGPAGRRSARPPLRPHSSTCQLREAAHFQEERQRQTGCLLPRARGI